MILHLSLAAISLALAEPAPSMQAVQERPHWAEFSRMPANDRGVVVVVIGTLAHPAHGATIYWAARHGERFGTTDSMRCPALAELVDSLREIELPTAVPGAPQAGPPNATQYSITLPASWGDAPTDMDGITVRVSGGPVKSWIDGALTDLDGCWVS